MYFRKFFSSAILHLCKVTKNNRETQPSKSNDGFGSSRKRMETTADFHRSLGPKRRAHCARFRARNTRKHNGIEWGWIYRVNLKWFIGNEREGVTDHSRTRPLYTFHPDILILKKRFCRCFFPSTRYIIKKNQIYPIFFLPRTDKERQRKLK